MKYLSILNDFWRHHPAVLYACAVLIGTAAALYSINLGLMCCAMLFFILPPLIAPHSQSRYRLFLAMALGFASFAFASTRYTFPNPIPSQPGIADIKIHAIQAAKTPFGSVWNYQGTLTSFVQNDQEIARNLPVFLSLSADAQQVRPHADIHYRFPARLKQTSYGKYAIKPIGKPEWIIHDKLYGLAEWRFSAKAKVQKHIQEAIRNPHVASFLSGIATGEFDDRLLAAELSRFGLQHLMAISGLHFSILSALCAFSISLFFSRPTAALVTLCLMSGYFLFLGASPSVTRAWVALLVGMTSLFIERHHSAINALGIATLFIVLWDPLVLEGIGFQFSFAITAGILLGFASCDAWLQRIFSKRPLKIVMKADKWDQHGYCILHFLRQSLALCLAVNSVALPLTLYHFHKFPAMSLVYNLFIPVLVSVSLMLLAVSCTLSLIIPWLGLQLHAINEAYTQFVLNFAFHLPKSFDWTWETHAVSKEVLLGYLLIIFCLGILAHRKKEAETIIGA